jgi:hypothetical protein
LFSVYICHFTYLNYYNERKESKGDEREESKGKEVAEGKHGKVEK